MTTTRSRGAPTAALEEHAGARTVGRYTILEEVGRGGMAVVYLARQRVLGRHVALKELRSVHLDEPDQLARFVRESRLSGSFSHPNIVTVYDSFEHEGTPYIGMEYLERGSLRPFIGRLSLAQAAGVLEDLLAGLAEAELRGIVHRDLKPENLLISGDGRVKIGDFGIAKTLEQPWLGASLTETGIVIGTPTYMAPEQATARRLDARTDLYAAGVIAYELFVGRPPFGPPDPPMAILFKHVQDPVPPPQALRPDLDPRLAAWLERMLAKAPEERPAGAQQAWEELEDVVLSVLGSRWRREARLTEVGADRPSRTRPEPPPVAEEPPAALVPSTRSSVEAGPDEPEPTPVDAATVVPVPPVLEPTPPRPERAGGSRRRRVAVVAAAAGLASAAAVPLAFTFRHDPPPPRFTLPAVTGMRESAAVSTLTALGFRVDARHLRRLATLHTPRGVVFAETPRPGVHLREGAFVTLTVSAGKPRVPVPEVRGKPLRRARKTLHARHLRVTTVAVHAWRPVGTVLAQTPSSGRATAWGSLVRLRVSSGPPRATVPALVGLPYELARARLGARHLRIVRTFVSSGQPAGTVVGQHPDADESVVRRSDVTVDVSLGPPTQTGGTSGGGAGDTGSVSTGTGTSGTGAGGTGTGGTGTGGTGSSSGDGCCVIH